MDARESFVVDMSKRERALRKKIERIRKIEEKVADGKELEPEQKQLLETKSEVEGRLKELQTLREKFEATVCSPSDGKAVNLPAGGSKKNAKHRSVPLRLTVLHPNGDGLMDVDLSSLADSGAGVVDLLRQQADLSAATPFPSQQPAPSQDEHKTETDAKGMGSASRDVKFAIHRLIELLYVFLHSRSSSSQSPLPENVVFFCRSLIGETASPENTFSELLNQSVADALTYAVGAKNDELLNNLTVSELEETVRLLKLRLSNPGQVSGPSLSQPAAPSESPKDSGAASPTFGFFGDAALDQGDVRDASPPGIMAQDAGPNGEPADGVNLAPMLPMRPMMDSGMVPVGPPFPFVAQPTVPIPMQPQMGGFVNWEHQFASESAVGWVPQGEFPPALGINTDVNGAPPGGRHAHGGGGHRGRGGRRGGGRGGKRGGRGRGPNNRRPADAGKQPPAQGEADGKAPKGKRSKGKPRKEKPAHAPPAVEGSS